MTPMHDLYRNRARQLMLTARDTERFVALNVWADDRHECPRCFAPIAPYELDRLAHLRTCAGAMTRSSRICPTCGSGLFKTGSCSTPNPQTGCTHVGRHQHHFCLQDHCHTEWIETFEPTLHLVCIQCALRAMVNNEPPPTFNETSDEHMTRMHPDPNVTHRERQMLEATLYERSKESS